jgi:uncharacterized protein YkwD
MLEEPYIKDPRSTFGGKYLADCQPITIPEEKVFVMGDNRKVSMDSRDIGLIDKEDIEFYLPYEEQLQTASSKWRDASQDENYALQTEFNQDKYIAMLNQKRQELGLQKLKYQPKLTETARKRAEVMLQYNDLSFEATRSGYTMEKAMTEAGYWNVVYGEVPTLGYYNEQELFDSFFEYEESKEFFMEPEYNEIGISTFVGKINGCPVQIVVQHLAGYKPPNYTANEIQSWKNALDNLRQVQPGWQKLKENDNFYNKNKTKVDRINEIIKIRTANISGIVSKMQSDQWLTDQEKQYMNQDKALYKEQNELAEEINEIIN